MARYIDADELKNSLGEPPENWTSSPEEIQALNDFYEFQTLIDSAPSADVRENVRGEWIKQYFDFRDNCQIYSCSKCGYQDIDTNFCPNCGADMRGEKDGEI